MIDGGRPGVNSAGDAAGAAVGLVVGQAVVAHRSTRGALAHLALTPRTVALHWEF